MKILGIDTTTKFLCLGLADGNKFYDYNLDLGTRHSVLLVPTIKRVLEALNWRIDQIDYFACGVGPGSFTGIRVGLATIKGLAWSLKKPVVGISTLDIIAKTVKQTQRYIVPSIDAKRNLIYCGIYKIKGGILKRTSPYMLLTVDEFLKKIADDAVLLGDALALYKERILNKKVKVDILDTDSWYPKAHNLITLAQERIKERKINNPFDIKPIYLYPKECQIRSASA